MGSLPIHSLRIRFGSIVGPFGVDVGSIWDAYCGCQVGSNANSLRIGSKSAPSRLVSKLNTLPKDSRVAGIRNPQETTGNQLRATPNVTNLPIHLISSSRSISSHPLWRPNQMSASPKSLHPLHVNSDRKQISLAIGSIRVRFECILNPFWVHLAVAKVGSHADSHRIGPQVGPKSAHKQIKHILPKEFHMA